MKVMFIGDVQGETVISKLPELIAEYRRDDGVDFVIVNGENSSDYNGLTPHSAQLLFDAGADVITTGNHAFQRNETDELYNTRAEVLRPANFGTSAPGRGVYVVDFGYCELCIVNIIGMSFMKPCDNPFHCMDRIIAETSTPNIIVDFHAEATAEKRAMGLYLAGKVSAVLGTHTHVQTADEQIIDNYTAYITDVGMVGAVNSVIGADRATIRAILDYYPWKRTFAPCDENGCEFGAVIVGIDATCGKAKSIQRIRRILY